MSQRTRQDSGTGLYADLFVDGDRTCDTCRADFIGRPFQHKCPPCAAVIEAEREARERRDKESNRELQLSDAVQSMPARFRTSARFTDPRLATWVRDAAAIKAAREATGTVVLLGPSGAGKSTLACCMLGRVIDAGRPLDASAEAVRLARGSRFVTARELAFARSTGGAEYGDEAPLVLDATAATLLVVDDIGNDPMRSDSALPCLAENRYNAGLPTIFTSALGEADMRARYGDGFTRRVFDGEAIDVRLKPERKG